MFNKKAIIIVGLAVAFTNTIQAKNPKKKVPQEGYISNYGPLQNLWRFYNYASGHNRKKEILEAIKGNDKEAFKKNFMEGDLVNQTDIVVEIIVNNNLELLQLVDEELHIDIKAVVEKHIAHKKNAAHQIPHKLVERHGSKSIAMLYFLNDHGIEIDVKNEEGNTIAHTVKDKVLVDEVVGKIVDVNSRNNQGETPVFIATKNNDFEKIKMLTTAQADVNIPNNEGITPGHIAASGNCSAACAKIIFESNMDPKAVNQEGISVKKTLGNTRHRECIKGLGKIKDKQTFSTYKKRCTHLTTIEHYFKQGYLKGLEQRIKKLKEEKNHLIDLETTLSEKELAQRKQLLEEQLARLELEKQKIEENRKNRQAELHEFEELEEVLNQEILPQEDTTSVHEIAKKEQEKNPDDSH